jgi:predicted phage terminase large subunit-like protein
MLLEEKKKRLPISQIKGIDTRTAKRKLCLRSFRYFCQQAWHVLEPNTPLEWNWHFDALCSHVQSMLEDWIAVMEAKRDGRPIPHQRIQNLAINIPPGTGKSRFISVFAPAWMWLRCPSWRAIFISGNPRVALRDADYCRTLIDSDWYRNTFKPQWTLAQDQNAKSLYRNTEGGFRMAISVGSRVTGDRGDALFIDDPNDAAEVNSDLYRDGVNSWWDQGAGNRVNDLRHSIRILIMQRLHEKDLTGHILKGGTEGAKWEHLIIPMEYRPEVQVMTAIGWSDPRKIEGELLFAKRFPETVLHNERLRLGPSGYAGQHQQTPNPAGGSRFKKEYFRYWTEDPNFYHLIGGGGEKIVNKADVYLFAALDPAGVDGKQNDKACFSCCYVFAVTPEADMMIISEYRAQVETPQLANDVTDLCRRYATTFLAVEQNGLGLGVVQTINQTGLAVTGVNATRNKEARSETAEIRMAAGKIYFPQGAEYLFDLETELLRFPNGEYCDRVDALAWGAILVQERHGAPSAEQEHNAGPVTSGRYRRDF